MGLTLAVAMRWVDLVRPELAAVPALVPVWGVGLLAVVVLSAVLRHRRLALAGVAPAVVVLVLLAVPLRSHAVATSVDEVTVMSANVEYGQADAGQLVAAVRTRSAAVLVLAEVTPEAIGRLDAAGLTTLLPYAAGKVEEGASGTVIRRGGSTISRPSPQSSAASRPRSRSCWRGTSTPPTTTRHTGGWRRG